VFVDTVVSVGLPFSSKLIAIDSITLEGVGSGVGVGCSSGLQEFSDNANAADGNKKNRRFIFIIREDSSKFCWKLN
jgi:hypothetical protein